ncbi:MAG: branched-chain amino acid ABC transporter permease, partial [Limnochordales bacterium]
MAREGRATVVGWTMAREVPGLRSRRLTVPLAIMAVAMVAALQPSDYFVLLYNFALITALLVLSLSLIFGYAGLLSLAHAAYFGIGAYVSALLTKELGLPVILGLLGAAAVAAVLGYLLAPMGKLMADYYAMGTLAFGLIMYTLFGNLSFLTGGWSGLSGVPALELFGIKVATPKQELILLSAVLAGAFLLLQQVTAGYTGRSYRAVRDDQVSARAIGLPVDKIKNHAVTIGCAIAGLAGGLMAHMSQFVGPESFSYFRSILLVLMVVVAGRDNLGGAVIVGTL